MQVISLFDLLSETGVEATKAMLSYFCVSRNPDVE